MFVGEMGCWLVMLCVQIYSSISRRSRGYAPIHEAAESQDHPMLKPLVAKDDHRRPLNGWATLLLVLPSACDIAGTTLMNVGLLFVAASIYQMTRGALVLFVGIFSVVFLHRRLFAYQWLALIIVVVGVMLVGLAGAIAAKSPDDMEPRSLTATAVLIARTVASQALDEAQKPDVVKTVVGVLMIAGAQVFTATQFVLEEFILEKYAIEPLKMVGWEGTFGFLVTVIVMGILHFTIGARPSGKYDYFDAVEGWRQLTQNRQIMVSSLLIMISIGGFNFFGLSVTRSVSATSRSTIDTCRTLFIWIVSLALHWETFKWLQIVGFVLLVYGTFLFNDLVGLPWQPCTKKRQPVPLLVEEPIEHM